MVRAAVALIPALTKDRSVSSPPAATPPPRAPSSELPARVGSQQTELGQDRARSGPVLGRRLEEQPVRVPDMRSEERWPDFARHGSRAIVWITGRMGKRL